MALAQSLLAGQRHFDEVEMSIIRPITSDFIHDTSFARDEAAEYCQRYQWAHIDHSIFRK